MRGSRPQAKENVGTRERGLWSRRLEEAREARRKVLAAREADAGAAEGPYRLGEPIAAPRPSPKEPARSTATPGRGRKNAAGRLRYALGLAAAALVGIGLLLATADGAPGPGGDPAPAAGGAAPGR